MDSRFAMKVMKLSDTACASCRHRLEDELKIGFCKVYSKTAKPAKVFKGEPCAFYIKENDGRD